MKTIHATRMGWVVAGARESDGTRASQLLDSTAGSNCSVRQDLRGIWRNRRA
jgi:hypothetical protein